MRGMTRSRKKWTNVSKMQRKTKCAAEFNEKQKNLQQNWTIKISFSLIKLQHEMNLSLCCKKIDAEEGAEHVFAAKTKMIGFCCRTSDSKTIYFCRKRICPNIPEQTKQIIFPNGVKKSLELIATIWSHQKFKYEEKKIVYVSKRRCINQNVPRINPAHVSRNVQKRWFIYWLKLLSRLHCVFRWFFLLSFHFALVEVKKKSSKRDLRNSDDRLSFSVSIFTSHAVPYLHCYIFLKAQHGLQSS